MDIDHTLMYSFFVKSLCCNEYIRAIYDSNIWHIERVLSLKYKNHACEGIWRTFLSV